MSWFVIAVSWDNVDPCKIILSIWEIVKLLIKIIKYSWTVARLFNWLLYSVKLNVLLSDICDWSYNDDTEMLTSGILSLKNK